MHARLCQIIMCLLLFVQICEGARTQIMLATEARGSILRLTGHVTFFVMVRELFAFGTVLQLMATPQQHCICKHLKSAWELQIHFKMRQTTIFNFIL